jgi:hypothetical protein
LTAGIVGFFVLRSMKTPQEEYTEASEHLAAVDSG